MLISGSLLLILVGVYLLFLLFASVMIEKE